jgi:DNA invertase Pin-like site-specific DNA recombinase
MSKPATPPGSPKSNGASVPTSAARAAIYLRVSTGRQAEQDLSIPDQRAQTRAGIAQRGWTLVEEFVEPGASATDDKRPEFRRMIERACDGGNAFDLIVVHSSRASSATRSASSSTCASSPSTA